VEVIVSTDKRKSSFEKGTTIGLIICGIAGVALLAILYLPSLLSEGVGLPILFPIATIIFTVAVAVLLVLRILQRKEIGQKKESPVMICLSCLGTMLLVWIVFH
jgi:tellurite resistance protein TehA-like permease